MDKNEVIAFFDSRAPLWDNDCIIEEAKIINILDRAGVKEGISVLDVACGTGVLFPFYLKRKVGALTGIDISSGMIKIAKEKFTDQRIKLINADVEEMNFSVPFDCCVIYNALPHFENPVRLITHLSNQLKPVGRLTVAHGMGRAQIDAHHSGSASNVSIGLIHEDELAKLFAPFFSVDTIISNEELFIVSGYKK
ncbi:MAG: class I SAM-dependent methyltransferase [Peptococcaceae bacterium]|nr:class I SAM-dependent methyltransferase [Peptococcaceae bacterium]